MRAVSLSPKRALCWFGFRQTLRAAVIIGLISGFMLVLQGFAYEKSYPDEVSRAKFTTTLASAPALGMLYGETRNLSAGTNGYMVYRVGSVMALITSVWGLIAVTRLLRGNEDDGRWEPVRAAAVTARVATRQVVAGFTLSWLAGYSISTLITIGVVALSDLSMAITTALIINLTIFLPALLFAAGGVLTSQLALTRQRALLLGAIPLFGLFLLRGVGNVNPDTHWLMALTPFGWANLVSPVLHMQLWWLLPFLVTGSICIAGGVWLAQRDLGSSIIKQSNVARPRYFLLNNSWQLALRQNMWVFAGWAAASFALMALMAGLASIATDATADSPTLSNSLTALGGNGNDLRVAFLGVGLVFMVMILMVMATSIIGAIRNDESKQYLDTILVQPQRRSSWLAARLLLGLSVIMFISLGANILTYAIAAGQGTQLNFIHVITTGICLVGSVAFLLGLGALIYGLKPRLASLVLYALLCWSFVVTLLSSVIRLHSAISHSSLFYYTSFDLATGPDWKTFGCMISLGAVMAALGVLAFTKRDTVTE